MKMTERLMTNLDAEREEEHLRFYRSLTDAQKYAYDRGWDHAFVELGHRDERSIPPLLRRFFWYEKEQIHAEFLPWWRLLLIRGQGHDEYCNPVFGVRVPGGVVFVRRGLKVRGPLDGVCQECREIEGATE